MHDCGVFGTVVAAAAAARSVETSGSRGVLAGGVGHHVAGVCSLACDGAGVVETPPQQYASDDQEQDATGQPDTHGQLPASPVVTFVTLGQSAEHLALLPNRIGGLTCHAQEVGGLREEVGQVCAGLTDRDAFLVHESFALVAHQQAVPVGVVHDAVEGVQAAGGRRPAHSGRSGGDIVHRDHHVVCLSVCFLCVCFWSCVILREAFPHVISLFVHSQCKLGLKKRDNTNTESDRQNKKICFKHNHFLCAYFAPKPPPDNLVIKSA